MLCEYFLNVILNNNFNISIILKNYIKYILFILKLINILFYICFIC